MLTVTIVVHCQSNINVKFTLIFVIFLHLDLENTVI